MKETFVYIRRREIKSPLGDDSSDHIWKIGSALNGTMPLSGLTIEEEKKYFPDILGISATSPEFGKRVQAYWNNMSVIIPDGEGKKLNITEHEGSPVNVHDWILYKYCLKYSRVANKKEDMRKSPRIRFYLFNEQEELKAKVSFVQLKQEATKLYFDLLEDKVKTQAVLRIMSSDIALLAEVGIAASDIDKATEEEKLIMLDTLATNKKSLNKFIEVAKNKDLITQSFIEECIFYKKLSRVPNTSTILRDTLTIGNTMKEAIAFIQSPKNNKVILELKAELKELTNKEYDSLKVKKEEPKSTKK